MPKSPGRLPAADTPQANAKPENAEASRSDTPHLDAALKAAALANAGSLPDLKTRAQGGDAEAQYRLGRLYSKRLEPQDKRVEKDDKEAVQWLRKAADQNHAEAQCALAWMFFHGAGVRQDQKEAEWWLNKAAEQGDVPALMILAIRAQQLEDHAEAIKWYRQLAERKPIGALGLADIYYNGKGVPVNEAEGAKWLRQAAEQGDATAQRWLGGIYQAGKGVPQDSAEAFRWFRKAAEQGEVEAQRAVGAMYFTGGGVEKDETEAARWLRKAAEQGNADAQGALGVMYNFGQGVEKDYVEAYAWYNLAAKANETAAKNRDIVERKMAPQQVAEAQKRTKELRALIEARSKKPQPGTGAGLFDDLIPTNPKGSATAFFVTGDGYLVTSFHVIEEEATVKVQTPRGLLPARVVKTDTANDLALLKVEGRFTALPLSSSRGVKLGDSVFTVGFPNPALQGASPKLARGDIASLAGPADDPRYFQISVPVQPGNSGGALVNAQGNVVGVVAAKLSLKAALATSGSLPENVNYAVKSTYLTALLESLPEVAAKLKEPQPARERKFDAVVQEAQAATVFVFVFGKDQ